MRSIGSLGADSDTEERRSVSVVVTWEVHGELNTSGEVVGTLTMKEHGKTAVIATVDVVGL